MDKITIIIADRDVNYIETFTHYIRSTEYCRSVIIKAFSHKDRMVEYISGHGAHVLLSEPELLPEERDLHKVDCTMVMDEFHSIRIAEKYPFVHKYQPLDRMMSTILSLYKDTNPKAGSHDLRNTDRQVIGVYSSVGGSGKTLLALNLAQQYVLRGQKALYVSLELFSSTSLMLNMSGESGFSQLLYYLKTNADLHPSQLERFIRRDSHRNVDYLDPPGHAHEMLEMTREDVELLLNKLTEMSHYDVIIIDLDCGLHERIVGALCSSHRILWIVTDNVQCVHKTRLLLKEYESVFRGTDHQFVQRVKFVLNKYMGTPPGVWPDHNPSIDACLPYIPDWKTVHSIEQIFAQPLFNQQVAKLFSELNRN